MKLRTVLGGIAIAVCAAGLTACGGVAPPDEKERAGQPSEVVSVAGRVTGGGMTLDVQIGHTFAQKPATNEDTSAEGAATIK